MQRLRNYAIAFVIAFLVLPITAASHTQDPPESSPQKTSKPEPSPGPSAPSAKFLRAKKPIPNRYIVVLKDDVVSDDAPLEVRRARVTEIAKNHAETYGGTFDYIYETALKGYAIQLPNEAAAIAISKLPEVRWVEEDGLGEWPQASPVKSPPVKSP